MKSQENKEHWENIYQTKNNNEVSWHQLTPKTSITYLEKLQLKKDDPIIDIGGGDSFLVDYLLNKGFTNITVLDISKNAIERAKSRLDNESAKKVTWIVSDITKFTPNKMYKLWHDRATFHFLTDEKDIKTYTQLTSKAIENDGHLILGTFSTNGPKKCSGIDIQRYNEDSMGSLFQNNFKKIACNYHDHTTPFNTTQNFILCSFKKC